MNVMLPVLTFERPEGSGWGYEVKYDGFRALCEIRNGIRLVSRTGAGLNSRFPEIVTFWEEHQMSFSSWEPLLFDGKLAVLMNPYKADFSALRKRTVAGKKKGDGFRRSDISSLTCSWFRGNRRKTSPFRNGNSC